MIDENAFGILIAHSDIESEEYDLEADQFVERLRGFRQAVCSFVQQRSPGGELRAMDLGHAIYLELADGSHEPDLLEWLRQALQRLRDCGFESAAVLTYGGRWIHDEPEPALTEPDDAAGVALAEISLPSEPFRRALDADAAARQLDDHDDEGWGPGAYSDVEALDALGKRPKNEPTRLRAGTGYFYRVAR